MTNCLLCSDIVKIDKIAVEEMFVEISAELIYFHFYTAVET